MSQPFELMIPNSQDRTKKKSDIKIKKMNAKDRDLQIYVHEGN